MYAPRVGRERNFVYVYIQNSCSKSIDGKRGPRVVQVRTGRYKGDFVGAETFFTSLQCHYAIHVFVHMYTYSKDVFRLQSRKL